MFQWFQNMKQKHKDYTKLHVLRMEQRSTQNQRASSSSSLRRCQMFVSVSPTWAMEKSSCKRCWVGSRTVLETAKPKPHKPLQKKQSPGFGAYVHSRTHRQRWSLPWDGELGVKRFGQIQAAKPLQSSKVFLFGGISMFFFLMLALNSWTWTW